MSESLTSLPTNSMSLLMSIESEYQSEAAFESMCPSAPEPLMSEMLPPTQEVLEDTLMSLAVEDKTTKATTIPIQGDSGMEAQEPWLSETGEVVLAAGVHAAGMGTQTAYGIGEVVLGAVAWPLGAPLIAIGLDNVYHAIKSSITAEPEPTFVYQGVKAVSNQIVDPASADAIATVAEIATGGVASGLARKAAQKMARHAMAHTMVDSARRDTLGLATQHVAEMAGYTAAVTVARKVAAARVRLAESMTTLSNEAARATDRALAAVPKAAAEVGERAADKAMLQLKGVKGLTDEQRLQIRAGAKEAAISAATRSGTRAIEEKSTALLETILVEETEALDQVMAFTPLIVAKRAAHDVDLMRPLQDGLDDLPARLANSSSALADAPSFFGPWLSVKGGASNISLMRRVQLHKEATYEIQEALGAAVDDASRKFSSAGREYAIQQMTGAVAEQQHRIEKLVARVDEAQGPKMSEIDRMLHETSSSAMAQSAGEAAMDVISPYLL